MPTEEQIKEQAYQMWEQAGLSAAACSPVYSGNWALLRMVLRERQ